MTGQMGSSRSRDVDAPLESSGGAATDFGLVVGINHYPEFRSLQGAVNDAQCFRDWLRAPDGGNVAEDNVRLVLSQRKPPKPVRDQVDEALRYLVERALEVGGRRLYFHFSGHGAGIPLGCNDVALLLATWSERFRGRALSKNEYSGKLTAWQIFEEVVILLDCCRTNTVTAFGEGPAFHYESKQRFATKLFTAYATAPGGTAGEDSDGEQHRGKFTRCLLRILRSKPGITARKLCDHLMSDLKCEGQSPCVDNQLPPSSRFGRPDRPLPTLRITFARARGEVTLKDGEQLLVDQWHVDRGPWDMPLEIGFYKIQDEAGASLMIDHDGREEAAGKVITHVVF